MQDEPPDVAAEIEVLRARLAAAPMDLDAYVRLAHSLFEWFGTLTEDELALQDLAEPFDLLRTAVGLTDGKSGAERAAVCADLGLTLVECFNSDPLAGQVRDEAIYLRSQAIEAGGEVPRLRHRDRAHRHVAVEGIQCGQ